MKRAFLYVALLVGMAALMVSCNSTDENLRAMVPDDAVGVVSIDLPKILDKARMIDQGNVVVPQDLKKVIEESDPTLLGDLIDNLPASGIDINSKCYVFFSPGIYKIVTLLPLVDGDATREMVRKITSSKMPMLSTTMCFSLADTAILLLPRWLPLLLATYWERQNPACSVTMKWLLILPILATSMPMSR